MNDENRTAESPTSTIDSTESTSISIETIVDRTSTNNEPTEQQIEKQTAAMENSTNTTNNYNKNSLTNSQISMISANNQKDTSPIFGNPELLLTNNEKKSPTPFALTEKNSLPSLEAHHHQQQVPIKSIERTTVLQEFKNEFPKQILFGIIQFALSIALVALGILLLVRDASLASTGCGIWAGGIAAIAGALSVINMKSAQTGFLAVSLICVASGTLALAMAGSGLVRDMNRLEQEETNQESIKGAISAGSGLIFALSLHLVVSIASVYHSAIKICSRENQTQMLNNAITGNNVSVANQQKMEEIIKSLAQSTHGRGGKMTIPENADKLMAMWMYTAKHAANPHHQSHHGSKNGGPPLPPRPIMLVPAGNGLFPTIGYHPRAAPGMMPTPMSLPYATLPLPVLANSTAALHPDDIKAFLRMRATQKTTSEVGRHLQQQPRRTGRNEACRRQRRRSESDILENRRAFTYTGLDRAIADDFLKQQEQSNSSNAGYSSEESVRDGGHDSTL